MYLPMLLSQSLPHLEDLANLLSNSEFEKFFINKIIMARKGLIQREKKRQKLEKKYHFIRDSLKKSIDKTLPLEKKWEIRRKLQSLPRNSAPSRLHRRCSITGRPGANYRDFGLSRHLLREMAHACLLPGVIKSSW
jgi:small subunit ribosomal protein S14